VTIQVSDSVGKTASKRFTFIVVEDEALVIATDTLPDAQLRTTGSFRRHTSIEWP
jgi:hypothetical protein